MTTVAHGSPTNFRGASDALRHGNQDGRMKANKKGLFLYSVDVWPVLTTTIAIALSLVPFFVAMPDNVSRD